MYALNLESIVRDTKDREPNKTTPDYAKLTTAPNRANQRYY
jgi:hypothetical protein